jgi:hypothetical protein
MGARADSAKEIIFAIGFKLSLSARPAFDASKIAAAPSFFNKYIL